jgi:hypothetical protein
MLSDMYAKQPMKYLNKWDIIARLQNFAPGVTPVYGL